MELKPVEVSSELGPKLKLLNCVEFCLVSPVTQQLRQSIRRSRPKGRVCGKAGFRAEVAFV